MKTIIFNPMLAKLSGITQPFMYYLQHVLSGRVVSAYNANVVNGL